MTTAQVTLQTKLQLTPAGRAGVVYKPVESSYFVEAQRQIDGMLEQSRKDDDLRYEPQTDSFGYRWIIVQNLIFEHLVWTIHMGIITLGDQGLLVLLLTAV